MCLPNWQTVPKLAELPIALLAQLHPAQHLMSAAKDDAQVVTVMYFVLESINFCYLEKFFTVIFSDLEQRQF